MLRNIHFQLKTTAAMKLLAVVVLALFAVSQAASNDLPFEYDLPSPRGFDIQAIAVKIIVAVTDTVAKTVDKMEKDAQNIINKMEDGTKMAIDQAEKLINSQREKLEDILETIGAGVPSANCMLEIAELPSKDKYFIDECFACSKDNTNFIRKAVKEAAAECRNNLEIFKKFIEEKVASCKLLECVKLVPEFASQQWKMTQEIIELAAKLGLESLEKAGKAISCTKDVSTKYITEAFQMIKKAKDCLEEIKGKTKEY